MGPTRRRGDVLRPDIRERLSGRNHHQHSRPRPASNQRPLSGHFGESLGSVTGDLGGSWVLRLQASLGEPWQLDDDSGEFRPERLIDPGEYNRSGDIRMEY